MSLEETFRTILAARLPDDPKWAAWIDGTAAELVASVPPQGIDRDALLSELSRMLRDDYEGFLSAEEVAVIAEYQTGRILALVRPVPPQGIDRDALTSLVDEITGRDALDVHDLRYWADRILALVRPVEGVS